MVEEKRAHDKKSLNPAENDPTSNPCLDRLFIIEQLINSSANIMAMADKNHVYRFVNNAYLEMHGKEKHDVIGKQVADVLGEQFNRILKPYFDRALAGYGAVYPTWFTFQGVGEKFISINYSPFLDQNGEVAGVIINVWDLTRFKMTEMEFRAIFDNSQAGILVVDENRIIKEINHRLVEILGYGSANDLIGRSVIKIHVNEKTFQEFGEKNFYPLVYGKKLHIEYQLRKKDGEPIWCTLSGKAIDDAFPHDLSKGVVWIIDDLSERKKLEEKLLEKANTDSLTGLFNRRYFVDIAEQEIKKSFRYDHHLSLMIIDIDHFKDFNDKYGHDIGDKVLVAFSKAIRENLRDFDISCRLGGEEFTVLLPNTGMEEATRVAVRLRKVVEEMSIGYSEKELHVTVSIGVSTITSSTPDYKTLNKQADIALYAAKNKGRNRVEVYFE